ncbi:MAG: hypothetical protein GKS01_01920 [Alphaproteobacteria bacterium]|nr:hypothetical protein [Alphaproteobacteria bacterium]
MADEPKINMGKEVLKGFGLMVKTVLNGFDLVIETVLFPKWLNNLHVKIESLCSKFLFPIKKIPSWAKENPSTALISGALVLVAIGSRALETEYFSFAYWQANGEPNRSEIFRNLGLFGVAFVGLGFGIWRAWTAYLQTQTAQKQANIAEQGLFTERFSKATEQLGNEQLSVRLGGIYSLWRLAEDSGLKDAKSVFDILCAFVRHPTPDEHLAEQSLNLNTGSENEKQITYRPDAQAILDLIGDPDSTQRGALPDLYVMDLHEADLRQADLRRKNFNNANLYEADLENSMLHSVHLKGAYLSFANLKHAHLNSAHLEGASLRFAHLENADLSSAQLENTSFVRTHLENANLSRANIEKRDLRNSYLEDTQFTNAKTKGVKWPEGFTPPDDVYDYGDDEELDDSDD